ncbi:MAG: glycosyltransferase family 39 protein [Xenococcus sp. MO_188.B8]|nr:glycosyltransferase family 39 protein [Xenococcus sp. MO_188.B8]
MPASNRIATCIDLLILILALAFMMYGIGNYGLYEPHESHFAMVAQEMLLRGDWITPHLNGAPYLNKPPLLYWLIAIATTIFGNTEFAARLPLALAGWLGIVIVWQWSRQLWGIEAGRIAIVMLSVSLGWFIFSHQLLIEVLLATLLIASNYFLWKLITKPQSVVYFLGFYSSVALCFLAKGLIGIIFISCGYFGLAIIHRRKRILKRTKLLFGILLILALVLPWAIAIEKNNPGFWHYFMVNEHLNRIFDCRLPDDYKVSKISALGYLGITAVWCLPWSLFLPTTLKFTWQQWQQTITTQKIITAKTNKDAIIILAIAFLLPIVFFLPLSSRLLYYGIPAIPPYIILCAGFYSQYLMTNNRQGNCKYLSGITKKLHDLKYPRSKSYLIYGLLFIFIGLVCSLMIIFLTDLNKNLLGLNSDSPLISIIIVIAITFALGWLISGIAILQKNYPLSLNTLVISFVIIYIAITIIWGFHQYIRSSKNLVKIAENNLRIDTLWIFEGSREIGAAAGISYYLNQGKNYTKTRIFIDNIARLPKGWLLGKNNQVYRNVLVLEDGGNNRLPPQFPGKKPHYLITKQQLQTYWKSDRPIVFVTDFLRQPKNPEDSLNTNLPVASGKPLFVIGQRRVYGNRATKKILLLKERAKRQETRSN